MSAPSRVVRHTGLWFAVGLALLATFVALRLRVTTDITHFLPSGRDHEQGELSRQLADSPLARTLVLSVRGGEPDVLAAAAATLAEDLARLPEVAWVQRGPTPDLAEAVFRLYGTRAAAFVSDRPEEEIPAALTNEALARAADALKSALASPLGPLVARLAPQDPLQWFPAILKRMERAQPGSLLVEGPQFFTRDRRAAILFVGGRTSAFQGEASRRLLAGLSASFAQANRAAGGALVLERAGVAPIALDAETRMRSDLTRISWASAVGVLALFFAFLGGLRGMLLALLPVLAGALTAATVGLLCFGQLHAITLAIGASLVGVALDYPILFLTHRTGHPEEPARTVARRIAMGILLGGLTTAAGFLVLGWSSFPGVRELAITSAAGILAALAVTRWILPTFAERPLRAPALARVTRAADALMQRLGTSRRSLLIPTVVLAVGLAAVGIPRVRWMDSLEALNPASPELAAETARVRASISQIEEGRLVIVEGANLDEALARNDAVAARLTALEGNALEGSLSLHSFLWSPALQRRNLAQVEAAAHATPGLATRVENVLAARGFRVDMFRPFRERLAAATPTPLTLDDLMRSPLAPLVRPFHLPLAARTGLVTFLRGVREPAAVSRAIAEVPGARLFEQRAFLDQTYARFRVQTLQAVGLGLLVIAAVLFARYRRLRATAAALVPAVLAAAATLGLFGVVGLPCNLLHVLSLLLVLSMGVDYGVFFVESEAHADRGLTLVSVAAACLTTLFSFGLLALSSTPALRAIGLTVGVGILASLVLAPLTLVLCK